MPSETPGRLPGGTKSPPRGPERSPKTPPKRPREASQQTMACIQETSDPQPRLGNLKKNGIPTIHFFQIRPPVYSCTTDRVGLRTGNDITRSGIPIILITPPHLRLPSRPRLFVLGPGWMSARRPSRNGSFWGKEVRSELSRFCASRAA